MSVQIISGPPVSGPNGLSKEAAEQALLRNEQFPKGADYTLLAHAGQWIAAVSTPDFQKEAEFPPSGGDDEPAGPPSDSTPDTGGSDDSGDDSSDGGSDSSDGPPKHEHDKGEGGEHGDKGGGGIDEIKSMLQMLLTALGLDPTGLGADGMAPGPDGPPGPPHPGAGGPPHPAAGGPDVTVHQRAMKPGETPPGGTPLGAPAFSKVKETHPWGHMIGKVPHFTVRESMGETEDITAVHDELQTIAKSGGFKVARFTPFHDENGGRHVEAVISTPKTSE